MGLDASFKEICIVQRTIKKILLQKNTFYNATISYLDQYLNSDCYSYQKATFRLLLDIL